jgi:hypothetical protein
MELIYAQIDQQKVKDAQVDAEIMEKKRRQQLIASTRDGLATEREKIR